MNQKMKIVLLSLAVVLAVGFAVYRIVSMDDNSIIDDADAMNALKWLRLADDGDYEDCRKNAADPEKWLELYKKNRESLEGLKSRRLRSKSIGRDGSYKIIFKSSFDKAPKLDEVVWIGKDAKVRRVEYQYQRMPFPRWNSQDFGKPDEIQAVQRAASNTVRAMKALDVEFFDQITLRGQKFRSGKRIVKRLQQITDKYGQPYKYVVSNRFRFGRNFPGLTEIEAATAVINCFYKTKNKNYLGSVIIVLYKNSSDASPKWEIYHFFQRRIREMRPRRTGGGARPNKANNNANQNAKKK